MKILIVDDEVPARSELQFILGNLLPDAALSEAKNGVEALEILEKPEADYDVVFLDINMPGKDGMAVAAELIRQEFPPIIIFATAYSEHAVEAFELAALDYVVKPFDERRLAKTVKRIERGLAQTEARETQKDALQTYLETLSLQIVPQSSRSKEMTKMWGERENGNRLLVDYADIYFVEADAKKVFIQTTDGEKLLVRQTLKDLDERLSRHEFARVHKGYLINLNHISEVAPWFSGGYLIKTGPQGEIEIPMSRRYAAKLKELTDW
ncbi:MAG: LytTR family DNA-binding domain-containing protein [Chloroflexota bacterium]